MDELIEKIKVRITELEIEKQKTIDELNRQAAIILAPYDVTLAELKKLLPPETDSDSPIIEG